MLIRSSVWVLRMSYFFTICATSLRFVLDQLIARIRISLLQRRKAALLIFRDNGRAKLCERIYPVK